MWFSALPLARLWSKIKKGCELFNFSAFFNLTYNKFYISIFSIETKMNFNSFVFQGIGTNQDHNILLLFLLIFRDPIYI